MTSNLSRKSPYHFAVDMCRYHWLIHEDTPKWRFWRRRKAYREADRWGQLAILLGVKDARANNNPCT